MRTCIQILVIALAFADPAMLRAQTRERWEFRTPLSVVRNPQNPTRVQLEYRDPNAESGHYEVRSYKYPDGREQFAKVWIPVNEYDPDALFPVPRIEMSVRHTGSLEHPSWFYQANTYLTENQLNYINGIDWTKQKLTPEIESRTYELGEQLTANPAKQFAIVSYVQALDAVRTKTATEVQAKAVMDPHQYLLKWEREFHSWKDLTEGKLPPRPVLEDLTITLGSILAGGATGFSIGGPPGAIAGALTTATTKSGSEYIRSLLIDTETPVKNARILMADKLLPLLKGSALEIAFRAQLDGDVSDAVSFQLLDRDSVAYEREARLFAKEKESVTQALKDFLKNPETVKLFEGPMREAVIEALKDPQYLSQWINENGSKDSLNDFASILSELTPQTASLSLESVDPNTSYDALTQISDIVDASMVVAQAGATLATALNHTESGRNLEHGAKAFYTIYKQAAAVSNSLKLMKIAGGFSKLTTASQLMMIGSMMSFANVMFMLPSLFGSQKRDAQIIIEAVQKMFDAMNFRMDTLRIQMHDRFDRIEDSLNAIHQKIEDLRKINLEILNRIYSIENQVDRIQRTLEHNLRITKLLATRPSRLCVMNLLSEANIAISAQSTNLINCLNSIRSDINDIGIVSNNQAYFDYWQQSSEGREMPDSEWPLVIAGLKEDWMRDKPDKYYAWLYAEDASLNDLINSRENALFDESVSKRFYEQLQKNNRDPNVQTIYKADSDDIIQAFSLPVLNFVETNEVIPSPVDDYFIQPIIPKLFQLIKDKVSYRMLQNSDRDSGRHQLLAAEAFISQEIQGARRFVSQQRDDQILGKWFAGAMSVSGKIDSVKWQPLVNYKGTLTAIIRSGFNVYAIIQSIQQLRQLSPLVVACLNSEDRTLKKIGEEALNIYDEVLGRPRGSIYSLNRSQQIQLAASMIQGIDTMLILLDSLRTHRSDAAEILLDMQSDAMITSFQEKANWPLRDILNSKQARDSKSWLMNNFYDKLSSTPGNRLELIDDAQRRRSYLDDDPNSDKPMRSSGPDKGGILVGSKRLDEWTDRILGPILQDRQRLLKALRSRYGNIDQKKIYELRKNGALEEFKIPWTDKTDTMFAAQYLSVEDHLQIDQVSLTTELASLQFQAVQADNFRRFKVKKTGEEFFFPIPGLMNPSNFRDDTLHSTDPKVNPWMNKRLVFLRQDSDLLKLILKAWSLNQVTLSASMKEIREIGPNPLGFLRWIAYDHLWPDIRRNYLTGKPDIADRIFEFMQKYKPEVEEGLALGDKLKQLSMDNFSTIKDLSSFMRDYESFSNGKLVHGFLVWPPDTNNASIVSQRDGYTLPESPGFLSLGYIPARIFEIWKEELKKAFEWYIDELFTDWQSFLAEKVKLIPQFENSVPVWDGSVVKTVPIPKSLADEFRVFARNDWQDSDSYRRAQAHFNILASYAAEQLPKENLTQKQQETVREALRTLSPNNLMKEGVQRLSEISAESFKDLLRSDKSSLGVSFPEKSLVMKSPLEALYGLTFDYAEKHGGLTPLRSQLDTELLFIQQNFEAVQNYEVEINEVRQ